jgi:hypothetical protein
MLLTHRQCHRLHAALGGRLIAVCYGAGADSTTMLGRPEIGCLAPQLHHLRGLFAENPPRSSTSIGPCCRRMVLVGVIFGGDEELAEHFLFSRWK